VVLEMAHTKSFTTKSDFARDNADFVAMAASEGYITTRIAAGYYGRTWQITLEGLEHLYILKGLMPPRRKAKAL